MSRPASHRGAAELLIAFRQVLCAAAATLGLLAERVASAQPVHIADPNLEAVVRATLLKPDGELTRSDMAEVEILTAQRRGITTVEGFVGATNLVELDLRFNELTEITLPPDLTSLLNLRLRGNPLMRLTASVPLPRVRRLNVSECLFTNVDFLTNFPALNLFEIQANDLTAFASPIVMTNLTWLDLAYNRVRNLAFLTNLPALTHLIMDDNGLTNVVFPGTLPRLTFVSFTINRIADLTFLRDLPNIEVLDLASNFSTNYVFPEGLTRLQWLNLGENRLMSVFFPPDMTNLIALYFDDNRFTTVPALSSLGGLRALDLGINQLTTITIPHTLTNLSDLDVSFNPLRTIIVPDAIATNRLHEIPSLLEELRTSGVTVHIYPVAPRLSGISVAAGATLRFVLSGPPGTHALEQTENLDMWSTVKFVTNVIGTAEVEVPISSTRRMFRTRLQ